MTVRHFIKNRVDRLVPALALFLFGLLLLPACGSIELGVDETPSPDTEVQGTQAVVATDRADLATEVAALKMTLTPRPPDTEVQATLAVVATERADLATQVAALKMTPTPPPPPTGTPAPMTPTGTPAVEATITPIPAPTELRVVYIQDANAWLWVEEMGGGTPLTDSGGVSDVKISGDGAIVAFVRDDELWAVNSDGTGERIVVSAADFEAMEPRESFESPVALYRFDWAPGTHILAFNTRLVTEIGLLLNDDLRLVDADSLEQRQLLPPGEGGEFTFSPDGRKIAVVTAGSISVMDLEAGSWTELFTYTPVITYSEVQFYAQPVWSPTSDALRVVIPPVDPLAQPSQSATVWHIDIDGAAARLIGDIAAAPGDNFAFSPDLSRVAYLQTLPGAPSGSVESEIGVTELDGDSAGATFSCCAGAYQIYGWAPDSPRVAFLGNLQLPQAQIVRLHGETVPAHADPEVAAIDLQWVDDERYLFLAATAGGWDILLRDFDGSGEVLASVSGRPPAFDFTD